MRPKLTRTTRHLLGPGGQSGNLAALDSPDAEAAPPMYRDRLIWEMSPKSPYDPVLLSTAIAQNPNEPFVFVDSSLFDLRTPTAVWNALLSRPHGITIIPSIRAELEPWLHANPGHPATHAIRLRDAAVDVRDYDTRSPGDTRLYQYYANLLGIRKKLLPLLRGMFEVRHGRTPTREELDELKREAHANFGERGYMLLKKGESAAGSPNFLTDEKLVVTAVMTGIRTGKPVFILTKDEDVLEQFYQMLWLLDTHYRGMLLAKAYVDDPSRFIAIPIPMEDRGFAKAFTGEDNLLVANALDSRELVLPANFTCVRLHCCVMGELMTRMTFIAETQMEELLDVKSETGGLNTRLLDGRNCHLWIGPLPTRREFSGCGAIALEQRRPWPKSTATFSSLDINQALFCRQPFEGLIRSRILA
jgi:hypothetical protein